MALTHRCKQCGRLEDGGHAGTNMLPHACRVCGAGVTWSGGRKALDSSNWEILADATPERLVELGLSTSDVGVHEPVSLEENNLQDLECAQANLAALHRREADWAANQDQYVREWRYLDSRAQKLQVLIDKTSATNDVAGLEKLTNDLDKVRQSMKDLESRECGARHHAHKGVLMAGIATHQGAGIATRQPRSAFVHAVDGAGAADSP